MRKWSNQHKRSRNSYPPAPGGRLDNTQKARICILAREAFDAVRTAQHFESWRQHEQFLAVNGADRERDQTSRLSLTDCTQGDYLSLVAHFENLKGETGRAVKTHLRMAVQEKEIALHKLTESCADRGLKLSYAEAICRRQYKCDLSEANAKQLWQLNFTVRNRRKALPESELPDSSNIPF